ncbi:hypothetical protein BJ875DRAFT_485103 [Amylocarpus encephaloides]|uniref:SprT-like domain-containing protein n=1 Tax=Amylocarpus encephaloides TaxID=45428 RepID=A0A9P7YGR3_9HELO|nr:hypothetical protein BJ875DRAFT_485103 [Amylocarpus encephaloides]
MSILVNGPLDGYTDEDRTHQHEYILFAELHSPSKPFPQRSISLSYLASMVSYYTDPEDTHMVKRQRDVIENYKEREHNALEDRRKHIDDKVIGYHAIFTTYMNMFDDLFFFGSLKNVITLVMDPALRNTVGLFGRTKYLPPRLEFMVTIYKQSDDQKYPSQVLHRMLVTLLHEMVHVFLCYFVCKECCDDWENTGRYAHGKTFMTVAALVSKSACHRGISNSMIPLENSLAWELVGTRIPLPELQLLDEWGIDKVLLEKNLQQISSSEVQYKDYMKERWRFVEHLGAYQKQLNHFDTRESERSLEESSRSLILDEGSHLLEGLMNSARLLVDRNPEARRHWNYGVGDPEVAKESRALLELMTTENYGVKNSPGRARIIAVIKSTHPPGEGSSGHGVSFMQIAMSLSIGLAEELMDSGREIPSADILKEWGLTEELVREEMDSDYDEESSDTETSDGECSSSSNDYYESDSSGSDYSEEDWLV